MADTSQKRAFPIIGYMAWAHPVVCFSLVNAKQDFEPLIVIHLLM